MELNPWLSSVISIIPYIMAFMMICGLYYIGYFYINKRKQAASSSIDLETSEIIYFFGVGIKKRTINKLFLALSSLPLLVYPLVLMGTIVSLAALGGAKNIFVILPGLLFFLYIISYLPIYIICVIRYSKKRDESILFSIFPLIYITPILILIFFF
ncbi:hypothetical protein SAMN05446037_1002259 [Anaerovirgula multivorans]|uniref:Uncharacterized protein n=1 Tax=Anaerovirgula multivorans TaxID=312168 RepID=A0A239AVM2_9FIRM|nr:hypothetical protein [Anaerovirgula multivorans]SNR99013.1 hypothetical protein SAMN05446037_1002259 [Anaerovirgula multivorans]